MSKPQDFWSGPTGFILATIGAAVGLGSIWKFPYEVGANGGGAFVLFYLVGVVLIVFPLMLVEFAVGRRGGRRRICHRQCCNRHRRLAPLGAMRLLGVQLRSSFSAFYSVIGGWAIGYAVETTLHGLAGADCAAAQIAFR